MHIVDLDGAKEGKPVQTNLIGGIISKTSLKVETGGGVRTRDDIARLLDAGAARVVVGTKAIEDWTWFESLAKENALADKLVLALDAKDGMVATRGWTETSKLKAVDVAAKVSAWPLAAILYTDVSKDGMLPRPQLRRNSRAGRGGQGAGHRQRWGGEYRAHSAADGAAGLGSDCREEPL